MSPISLETRQIGVGQPVLVIAEIGVNHDGSVDRALELTDIAAESGADAVKLQVFDPDRLLHRSCRLAEYQAKSGAPDNPAEMLRKYQLSPDELRKVCAHIRARRLLPIATPFSPADIETVSALNLAAVKIASPDIVNRLLLDRARQLRLPMFLSTGAATMDEIVDTCDWLRLAHQQYALLHCVSSYPTELSDANLGWIGQLQERCDVPVGYSDHTTDVISGAMSVCAGARLVERHLTYDRAASGPDHAASSDPAEFKQYVKLIRQAETMLGQRGKTVLPCEEDVRSVSRQSLVLARPVQMGHSIEPGDLTTQRPGTGILPNQLDVVLGRKAARDLAAGSLLTWEMLGGEPRRRSA